MIRRCLNWALRNVVRENTADLRNILERLVKNAGIGREQAMNLAFEFCAKSDMDGVYLEFGCAEGASLIRAYRAYTFWLDYSRRSSRRLRTRKMFVFDSFEGLPEPGLPDHLPNYSVFEAGQYRCSQDELEANLVRGGVALGDVAIVPGAYDQALGEKAALALVGVKAVVVHIDCDLYASARLALDFVTPFLQDGTVLLFDDFYCYRANPRFGERRAFAEWAARNSAELAFTEYFRYSWAGCAFIVNRVNDCHDSVEAEG
jgi:hypothetical protein